MSGGANESSSSVHSSQRYYKTHLPISLILILTCFFTGGQDFMMLVLLGHSFVFTSSHPDLSERIQNNRYKASSLRLLMTPILLLKGIFVTAWFGIPLFIFGLILSTIVFFLTDQISSLGCLLGVVIFILCHQLSKHLISQS